ncbi:MAG: hypothetical protein ACX933_16360 [Marinobacter adhaerens]
MRTLLQHSLILWLCLFSSFATAVQVDTVAEAWSGCQARLASTTYEYAACFHYPESKYVHFANQSWNSPGPGVSYQYLQGCPGDEEFDTSTGACESPAPPPCDPPNVTDPDTGECLAPKSPQECDEIGEFYNPRTQQCVPECPNGALDRQCLSEPENQCDETSPDYEGTIGWGSNRQSVCGGDNQCQDDETYAFRENAEGSWSGQCISNDANPPICPNGFKGALIITDGGFACEGLNPDPDNPNDPNDTSDGDSDGDGEGDTTGIAGQLQDIKGLLSSGNTERSNIKNQLDGIGKSIKDGTSAITDAIGNIPGWGGGGGNGDGNGKTEIVGEDGESITWSGDPIDTELTDPTEDYDQVMADCQAKINEIKGEVQAMFSTNLSGGGSVDDNTKTIMGVDVNFSLNRFLAGLDILGAIVLFCAAFISAGILFAGKG